MNNSRIISLFLSLNLAFQRGRLHFVSKRQRVFFKFNKKVLEVLGRDKWNLSRLQDKGNKNNRHQLTRNHIHRLNWKKREKDKKTRRKSFEGKNLKGGNVRLVNRFTRWKRSGSMEYSALNLYK